MQTKNDSAHQIDRERLKRIYTRTPLFLLSLLAITTLSALLLECFPRLRVAGWYSAMLLVLGLYWHHYRSYLEQRRREGELSQPALWLKRFRRDSFLIGLAIGSLVILFPADPATPNLFLQCLFSVNILAAAAVMLPDFSSCLSYVITLLLPLIGRVLLVGDRVHYGIGLLLFFLGLFFLLFSRELNDSFNRTTRLQSENRDLLQTLEQEKRKPDDHREMLPNDSHSEIYVVDSKTLHCLQVNRGAIDNLGYSEEEFTRIRLNEIFNTLDEEGLRDLLQPLYDGSGRVVEYRGLSRRKNGSLYPVEARLQLSLKGTPAIVVTARDISERSEWEKRLIYQANFDQLTGLFNRHYMQAYMESVFSRARRNQNRVGLLFLDLDNFKFINDTFGHSIGDEILREAAERIRTLLRESDTPARTGGDEFTILLEDIRDAMAAETVAHKLVERFHQPFKLGNREIHVTLSIGISIFPDDGESLEQLLQYADMAMYMTKMEGRNGFHFFSPEMCAASKKQMELATRLHSARKKDEFAIYYQPVIDSTRKRIRGAEALLRWRNPDLGEVAPGKFIPLAESSGLIDELGSWVLERACREAALWHRQGRPIYVSVNVSSRQFRGGKLLPAVTAALAASGLPAASLQLEITESLLLQDTANPARIFQQLRALGVRLALDDFGTGYSSLGHLRQFPLQVLKIDQGLIRELEEDQNSRALIRAIIALAHSLNMEIVAEGIENPNQLEFLRLNRVENIQGFYYSPAIPAAKFRKLLESGAGTLAGSHPTTPGNTSSHDD